MVVAYVVRHVGGVHVVLRHLACCGNAAKRFKPYSHIPTLAKLDIGRKQS